MRRASLVLGLLVPLVSAAQAGNTQQIAPLAQYSSQIEKLAADVAPGVVQIQVSVWLPFDSEQGNAADILHLRHIIGSGVIVDPSGYILTNEHVIHNARRIQVLLTAGSADKGPPTTQMLEAIVVGLHLQSDLALLKVEASGLRALPFAPIGSVRQGQVVAAVGSPEGLDNTFTLGVVSAVGRQSDPNLPMVYIQTDAAINPGNSGGPLLDMNGNVVGINTFLISETGVNQGLGFAIPAPVAHFVYEQLRDHGFVHRNSIGAEVQAVTPQLARALHLPRNDGILISDVAQGGPAEAAGLQVQDVIVEMDGAKVPSLPAFAVRMSLHDKSSPMELKVLRHEDSLQLQVSVIDAEETPPTDLVDPTTTTVPQLGILGRVLDTQFARRLGLRSKAGVYVVAKTEDPTNSDSVLSPGDVIVSFNGTAVYSVLQLQQSLEKLAPDDSAALQIERKHRLLFVPLELE